MIFSSKKCELLFNDYVNRADREISQLEDKPEETSVATIAALWNCAAGNFVSAENSSKTNIKELSENETKKLENLFEDRLSGVPLGHLTRRQKFMGIEMLADKSALIPRKETELLGALGLQSIKDAKNINTNISIIDVCTGSGNLACSFAKEHKDIKVFASDLSVEAVILAKENSEFIGVSENTEFRSGDLLEPFNNPDFLNNIDVITCNPPYISTEKLEEMPCEIISHEPEMAFNGGSFGINILRKLAEEANRYLKSGGSLCIEVGLGQGPGMIKMFERSGNFSLVETLSDKNNNIRAIRLKKVAS